MANSQVEMQQKIINTPESMKSNNSSNFTFEADLLPIDLSRDLFEVQIQLMTEKFEELLNKYESCRVYLEQAIGEEILLQEENLNLRAQNIQLSALLADKEHEIRKEHEILAETLALSKQQPPAVNQISGDLIRENEKKAVIAPRGVVPKMISVRSTSESLLAMSKSKKQCDVVDDSFNGIGSTGSDAPIHRVRLIAKHFKEGEESEEGELEVYKQGMLKTELCNKWEETGDCPYGERCQFAHGIKELRPVLRHPRYKTEICRMISSGGTCPYGHRCHFRHTLDPNQEKEVVL